MAVERGGGLVELGVVRVGTLERMHRVLLQPGDGLLAAAQVTPRPVAVEAVHAGEPPVVVHAAGERVLRQERHVVGDRAIGGREHEAQRRLVRVLAAGAGHVVGGQRLDHLRALVDPLVAGNQRFLLRRHGGEAAHREVANPPGDLRRTDDGRGVGHLREFVVRGVGRALRRAADAPRVEQARAVPVVAVHVEAERAGALDEERPPLREECFEGVEVDDGGVCLDLTEIRVGGGGKRQTWGDGILQVQAHATRPGPANAPACCRPRRRASRPAPPYTASARSAAAPRPGRMPPISANCDTKPLALRDSNGQVEISLRRAISRMTANPTGPPSLLLKRSCENGIRNSARPAFRVPRHLHVPHRVPAVVAGAVVVVVTIALDADRVHRELVRRSVIEVGIDNHLQPVGGRRLIAPREEPDDALGFGVEGANRRRRGPMRRRRRARW